MKARKTRNKWQSSHYEGLVGLWTSEHNLLSRNTDLQGRSTLKLCKTLGYCGLHKHNAEKEIWLDIGWPHRPWETFPECSFYPMKCVIVEEVRIKNQTTSKFWNKRLTRLFILSLYHLVQYFYNVRSTMCCSRLTTAFILSTLLCWQDHHHYVT